MSLEEVGKQLGFTRERVRQIEFKALKKLGFIPSGQHYAGIRADADGAIAEIIAACERDRHV